MVNVLLVIEDYGEMIFLQTLLKKLGFNVEGIQSGKALERTMLSFYPEILIMTAHGRRISGVKVAKELKKIDHQPCILLLAAAGQLEDLRGQSLDQVDDLLESPVNTQDLLKSLARFSKIDPDFLMQKYKSMKRRQEDQEIDLNLLRTDSEQIEGVSSSHWQNLKENNTTFDLSSTLPDSERKQRFAQALSQIEKPMHNGFAKEKVRLYHKKIREQENPQQLQKLEEERQSFVKTLFNFFKK